MSTLESSGASGGVAECIERKDYARAADLLRGELARAADQNAVRVRLADVLVLDGKAGEAAVLFRETADDYARRGAPGKAIAVLKKVQQLDPAHVADAEASMAQLSKERDRESARRTWERATEAKRGRSSDATAPEAIALELDDEVDLKRQKRISPLPGSVQSLEFELDDAKPVRTRTSSGSLMSGAMMSGELFDDRPDVGSSPLFSDFSTEELLAVMRGFRLVLYEPGDILVTEGAPGDSLFVLTTGTVKAFVHDADGNSKMVRRMTEGSFFGEVAVLRGTPRTATIVAASACEALELDRKSLDEITRTHPRVRDVLETFCKNRLGSAAEKQGRAGNVAPEAR